MRRNFTDYQESIADELKATKNRVRNLIGDAHWLTDGEHKEAALRKVLKSYLPESVRVGTGFVCYPHESVNNARATSTQLDTLISSIAKPTLFKDGDLTIVTADAAEAIIEVKTKLSPNRLNEALKKLADQVERVRENAFDKVPAGNFQPEPDKQCWAGLFVFDSNLSHRTLMEAVSAAADGKERRVVNCIAAGPNLFLRYLKFDQYDDGLYYEKRWHSYDIRGLAIGYFVSNLVWHISDGIPLHTKPAWFPIEEGKETQRKWYATLQGKIARF
jgi:hypothetical protein